MKVRVILYSKPLLRIIANCCFYLCVLSTVTSSSQLLIRTTSSLQHIIKNSTSTAIYRNYFISYIVKYSTKHPLSHSILDFIFFYKYTCITTTLVSPMIDYTFFPFYIYLWLIHQLKFITTTEYKAMKNITRRATQVTKKTEI